MSRLRTPAILASVPALVLVTLLVASASRIYRVGNVSDGLPVEEDLGGEVRPASSPSNAQGEHTQGESTVDSPCDANEIESDLVFEVPGRLPTIYFRASGELVEVEGSDPEARGQFLVYLSVDRRQISVMELATGDLIASRSFDESLAAPTITSDGGTVVVVVEGSDGTRLVQWAPGSGEVVTVHDPSGPVASPAISDDGRHLAWVERRTASDHVVVASLDSWAALETSSWAGTEPTWSPDGASLAYVEHYNDGRAIFVRPLVGDRSTRLSAPVGAVDSTPAWSPRCDVVAFVRTDGGSSEIWVALVGGEEFRLLSPGGIRADLSFTDVETG